MSVTPRQVAEQLRVDVHTPLKWISKGELVAVNVAKSLGGRPRWRISEAALEEFLRRRQAQPATPRQRRRKASAFERKYYT